MSRKVKHTANRIFAEYTKLRSFSPQEAGIVFRSVEEASESGGKAELEDARQFASQSIHLKDRILIPEALLDRHMAHLGFRQDSKGKMYSDGNVEAIRVINSSERTIILGPDAYRMVVASWVVLGVGDGTVDSSDGEPDPDQFG